MAGTGASNLGYGGTKPFSNVDGGMANKFNMHTADFTSKKMPDGPNQLSGIKNNDFAASGKVNSLSLFKGGGQRGGSTLRQKLKNIARQYKGGSKRMRTKRRSSLRRRYRRRRSGRRRNVSRRFYGGAWSGPYQQYGSNMANTRGYSLGGPMEIDGGKNIALANPPLKHNYIGGYRRSRQQRGGMNGVPQLTFTPCKTGCMDNYNHFNQTCGKMPYAK
jgi:hypothetical protein